MVSVGSLPHSHPSCCGVTCLPRRTSNDSGYTTTKRYASVAPDATESQAQEDTHSVVHGLVVLCRAMQSLYSVVSGIVVHVAGRRRIGTVQNSEGPSRTVITADSILLYPVAAGSSDTYARAHTHRWLAARGSESATECDAAHLWHTASAVQAAAPPAARVASLPPCGLWYRWLQTTSFAQSE